MRVMLLMGVGLSILCHLVSLEGKDVAVGQP